MKSFPVESPAHVGDEENWNSQPDAIAGAAVHRLPGTKARSPAAAARLRSFKKKVAVVKSNGLRIPLPPFSIKLTDKEKQHPSKPRQRRRSQNKSSDYRGVSKCAKDGRWQARIRVGRSVKYLGRFRTEPEAAMCYDQAAREYHGADAIVNFPDIVLTESDNESDVSTLLDGSSYRPAPSSCNSSVVSSIDEERSGYMGGADSRPTTPVQCNVQKAHPILPLPTNFQQTSQYQDTVNTHKATTMYPHPIHTSATNSLPMYGYGSFQYHNITSLPIWQGLGNGQPELTAITGLLSLKLAQNQVL